jgi:DNA polymerase I
MKYICIDTETTGLDIYKGARPFLYQVYDGENEPIVSRDISVISKHMADPDVILIGHNIKFDLEMLSAMGVTTKNKFYDTMIMKHLVDPTTPKSLEYCAKTFLNKDKQSDKTSSWFKANGIKKEDIDFSMLPEEILLPYAAQDVILTYELFFYLKPIIEKYNMWELLEQECKLVNVLIEMRKTGWPLDVEYFNNLKVEFTERIKKLESSIYGLAGQKFNISSPKQLAEVLNDNGVELPMTDKGNLSAKFDVLVKIDNPLVKAILDYRHDTKLLSTYIEPFSIIGDEIHCNLNAQGTVTGRFSSSNPNIQNIPRSDKDIRKGFIIPEGYCLAGLDYKQMEYRVFADYTKSPEIIYQLNNGVDYHTLIANQLKDVLSNIKTKYDARALSKTVNFMIIYGGGTKKLAEYLQISYSEAAEILAHYFKMFPIIKPFINLVGQKVKTRGYIFNKFGRRYYIPSSEAYKGTNYLIQGTCADMVKVDMLKCNEYLKDKKSKMVLQLHDELLFFIHNDEMHIIRELQNIMEDWGHMFQVNMLTDVKLSKSNWASTEEYKA